MVVLPVMADINFNQNTFKRKTGKKGRGKRFKVVAKYLWRKIKTAAGWLDVRIVLVSF